MAKTKKSDTSNPETSNPETSYQAPEGYRNQSDDIVGTWNPEDKHPVHFVPLHVKLSDSGVDKYKTSVLIFGKLVDACKVHAKDADGEDEVITAEPGDVIGIWYKAGMRKLLNLGMVPVWMRLSGEKDVGKPSKMKTFEIMSRTKGQRLKVEEDNRKDSQETTIFDADGPRQPDLPGTDIPTDANGNPIF